MISPTRSILFCVILSMASLGLSANPDIQLRTDEESWDKEISMDLIDADLRRVYALIFQIADSPVLIDECVEGRVTLTFENVTVRDALASTTRMGDFTVRPRRSGYFVGCTDRRGKSAPLADADVVRLEFTLTNATDGSVISRPTLAMRFNEVAEMEQAREYEVEDLDDTGTFFSVERRAGFRIKVFVDRDEQGIAPDSLRGVLELTSQDTQEPRTRRMAAQSFEYPFPVGTTGLAVASFELGGESYELTVSRFEGFPDRD